MKKIVLGIAFTIAGLFVLLRVVAILVSAVPGLGYQLYKTFIPDGFETCEKNGGLVYGTDNPTAGAKECYLKGEFYNSMGSHYSSSNYNCVGAGLNPLREEECIKGSFRQGTDDALLSACDIDKTLIAKEPNSRNTTCRLSTLSGDTEKRLFVLDKITDVHYVFRILDAKNYKTELYREKIEIKEPFKVFFNYYGYSDITAYKEQPDKEYYIVLDDPNIAMPGFPVKNSQGYKVVWKYWRGEE